MSATLTIYDETTGGQRGEPIVLEFLTSQITVGELIRERVYQEVKDFNLQGGDLFRGLIQPTDAEQALNGYKLKKPRTIDWRPQFEKACNAFESLQVLVLINDRQAESLDETITVGPDTNVSFLKLVPLVGG